MRLAGLSSAYIIRVRKRDRVIESLRALDGRHANYRGPARLETADPGSLYGPPHHAATDRLSTGCRLSETQ